MSWRYHLPKRSYVSCRESKLTRFAQDAFGGKSKSAFLFTVSPAHADLGATVATLELSTKAKGVWSTPEVCSTFSKNSLVRVSVASERVPYFPPFNLTNSRFFLFFFHAEVRRRNQGAAEGNGVRDLPRRHVRDVRQLCQNEQGVGGAPRENSEPCEPV